MTYPEICLIADRLAAYPRIFAWRDLRGELALDAQDLTDYHLHLLHIHRLEQQEPALFRAFARAVAAECDARYIHRHWLETRLAFMLLFFSNANEFLHAAFVVLQKQQQVQP
ncbi:MAG: hypothetical protein IJ598_12030 [Ruminococcus sp.]|nr:hypothetical protein [Ruminococcus sp.]